MWLKIPTTFTFIVFYPWLFIYHFHNSLLPLSSFLKCKRDGDLDNIIKEKYLIELFPTCIQGDIRAIYLVRYDGDWFPLWTLFSRDPIFLKHPPSVISKVGLGAVGTFYSCIPREISMVRSFSPRNPAPILQAPHSLGV